MVCLDKTIHDSPPIAIGAPLPIHHCPFTIHDLPTGRQAHDSRFTPDSYRGTIHDNQP